MVKASTIFQPLAGQLHKKEVVKLLAKAGAKKIRIATAFANSAGVAALKTALIPNAEVTRIFVGIRNGATTLQGILALLSTEISVYVVDTGSPYRIFHPKLYVIERSNTAQVIIGSANATHAGLHNNIEAGVLLELDLSDKDDQKFLDELTGGLTELRTKHPNHCYKIKSIKQAEQLLADGLVEDERSPRVSVTAGKPKGSKSATLPIIGLPFTAPPASSGKKTPVVPPPPSPPTSGAAAPVLSVSYGDLVWVKPKLPDGDLQFPAKGNPTGVLRLTQAQFKVDGDKIDKTTYFRYTVFGSLAWAIDPKDPDKEIAVTTFALIIAGLFVGEFELQLSHKPKWESGQSNYTTALHWGEAMPHIKHRSLIGRALRLYAPASAGSPYIVEIDI